MITLRQALDDYLAVRRALGFKLQRDAKLLDQFLTYLEVRGTDAITVDDALAWASLPTGGGSWLSFRLSVVRGFAKYVHSIDPTTQVPPVGLLPPRPHRSVPYLYSDADIAALIAAAAGLRYPLRVTTYQTLIGLLRVSGMRVGEAIGLDDTDFDIERGLLTVRGAKFGKSRLIPLHPSTVTALRGYQRRRDELNPHPISPALFVSTPGSRLLYVNVSQTFTLLVRRSGLAARSASCRPRPHDLRHSFAVATLLDWYRDGGDVAARLPLLSTYLGHVDPKGTYWYLQAAPELLALAAERLDAHQAGRP